MTGMNRLLTAAICCLVLVAALTGCKPFQHPWALKQSPPPDFSLEVTVLSPWQGPDDPLRTPSQYVVLPDRKLHAAIGPGATTHYFPQPTATLSHDQYAMLWSIVRNNDLMTFEDLDAQAVAADEQAIEQVQTPQEQALDRMPGQVLEATESITEIREQNAEREMINEARDVEEAMVEGEPLSDKLEPGRTGKPDRPEPVILPVPEEQIKIEEQPLPSGIYEITDDAVIPVDQPDDPRMNLAMQVSAADEIPTTQATDADEPSLITLYRVHIRAYGQDKRYTTEPDDSPATALLVRRLAELRGWTPVLRQGVDGETIEVQVDRPINP